MAICSRCNLSFAIHDFDENGEVVECLTDADGNVLAPIVIRDLSTGATQTLSSDPWTVDVPAEWDRNRGCIVDPRNRPSRLSTRSSGEECMVQSDDTDDVSRWWLSVVL